MKLDKLVVVGGGDVGLLTALSVRKLNPSIDISVVDDFDRAVPTVGKSTFEKILNILHGTLEIDESRFISEVKPVWKASVYFRDWCGYPSFHYPFDPQDKYPAADTPRAIEHFHYYYDTLYDSPDHLTRGEEIVDQGKSPWYFDSNGDLARYDKVAYHLNSRRFNSFLRDLCQERDVSLVDDEIIRVETTGTNIEAVQSERHRYEADLYIDATGFNRMLRREQDVPYRDFGFPLDRAFNVRLDRSLSDIIPATVVETGEYGWFWHIDTYDNRDLGYVFSSQYIDDEAALREFEDYVEAVAPNEDTSVEPLNTKETVDRYEFTSGYYEQGWADNCLAIGNAGGFVEPLQSTALTANAILAVRLSNLLSAHGRIVDDSIREAFNKSFQQIWELIYDFISIHYHYSSGETDLWEALPMLEVSDRTERIIEGFNRTGFAYTINTAPPRLAGLHIFALPDFYTIMRNMGATSEFYETTDIVVSDAVVREQDQIYRSRRKNVEENHITTRQLYEGVLLTQT